MGTGNEGRVKLEALLTGRVLEPALWTDNLLAAGLTGRLERIAASLAWSRWRRHLGGPDALSVANRVMADLPRVRFRGDATVARFLARCVELSLLNHFRNEGRAPKPHPIDWDGTPGPGTALGSGSPPLGPPAASEARERALALRDGLDELGSPCRELILAYYGGGDPDADALRVVGGDGAKGTLYQRVWRCREKLRRIVQGRGFWEADDGR